MVFDRIEAGEQTANPAQETPVFARWTTWHEGKLVFSRPGPVQTDVYAGKLHPRIAAGLAPLLNLQLRAIETSDVERRLARLEKLSAEAAEATGSKGPS
jgi:hypothetical protein